MYEDEAGLVIIVCIVIVRNQVCIFKVSVVEFGASIRHICVCVTSSIVNSFLEITLNIPAFQ